MTDRSPEWLAGYAAAREQAAILCDRYADQCQQYSNACRLNGAEDSAIFLQGLEVGASRAGSTIRTMQPHAEREKSVNPTQ